MISVKLIPEKMPFSERDATRLKEGHARRSLTFFLCSRFPIPDSRFPIPDSRFPISDFRFPILNS
ncbi:hypothetical protein [Moorena sp. SIO4G3]|uniref:hypothetical protein n=1 Tax=Moorena sp. SIO4G3 TaxID=2607821 RepID=UPI00142BB524|nr:hypothetical protein [Moorena sp. SIO4G3]NEO79775.1 hypothetical protein [Moorena sp. SIO4G3]